MSSTTYLFIDGAYLTKRYRECINRYYNREVELMLEHTTSAVRALAKTSEAIEKVFYYDCVDDLQKTGESSQAHLERVKAQEEALNSMQELPGWHVCEGRLVGARRDGRRQKRVDVQLTVDMLSHAFNKNMQNAILIAGDDDFTPLVAELLRHGTYVVVLSDRRCSSSNLARTADTRCFMDYHFYWKLTPRAFHKEHPLPDTATTRLAAGGHVLKFGQDKGGNMVKIIEHGGQFHLSVPSPQGYESRVRCAELTVLEQYLAEFYEDLVPERWEVPVGAAQS